jgi:PPK2 family polyphosphate:nucleotide phosphotransferase
MRKVPAPAGAFSFGESNKRSMSDDALLVPPGRTVRLADYDPASTGRFHDKADAREKLVCDVEHLAALQDVFAAAKTKAMLVVLQGMDAAGKDGAIKHVMSGMNPQGVDVTGFKQPTEKELGHDYLWRYVNALPERGRIAIFNRSYYEEVLVVRVHKDLLKNENPSADSNTHVWRERFQEINDLERRLCQNGTDVVKFFLHVSQEEQRRRLLDRLDDPSKTWKFSMSDLKERQYWDQYQLAYEHMLNNTSTQWAPWYVIPADHKWFMRTAIADILVRRFKELDLHYPAIDPAERASLDDARTQLK